MEGIESVEISFIVEYVIESGDGVEEASGANVRCAWTKSRKLSPLVKARSAPPKVRENLRSIYMFSV
jgi:hypothetical protein